MSDDISQLRILREKIAHHIRTRGGAELDGRLLRATITAELRAGGMAATPAAEAAKVDERYIAHERARLQAEYDGAVLEAQAEALLLTVRLQIAAMERVEI